MTCPPDHQSFLAVCSAWIPYTSLAHAPLLNIGRSNDVLCRAFCFHTSAQSPLYHTPRSPPTRRVLPSPSSSSGRWSSAALGCGPIIPDTILHLRKSRPLRPSPLHPAPIFHQHRASPDRVPARTVRRWRLYHFVDGLRRVRMPLDACLALVAGSVRVHTDIALQAVRGGRAEAVWRRADEYSRTVWSYEPYSV